MIEPTVRSTLQSTYSLGTLKTVTALSFLQYFLMSFQYHTVEGGSYRQISRQRVEFERFLTGSFGNGSEVNLGKCQGSNTFETHCTTE